jgi:serine/threonine-protein kinase HipA
MNELLVLIGDDVSGSVRQDQRGQLSFEYDSEWRESSTAYPLSLSMPLNRRRHGDTVVRPFLEGLLPDNNAILDAWAKRFQVSARNPFALLAHMGEDCPGAVRFVRPERLEELTKTDGGSIEWLGEDQIADRLDELVLRQGVGRRPEDPGYFSLAGAQPKMPLHFDGVRWGIPSGQIPTTHILKPSAQGDLEGFEINEHLCLRLAAELGLAVASSGVLSFAGRTALVVERYDRIRLENGTVKRVHQEDCCQALAVSPSRKYQNEGGPGPQEIVSLLAAESDDAESDVGAFLDSLALNWAMGGTDAHAKNYSVLITSSSVRLAPLYDLISILPYPQLASPRQMKLAMKIGSEYLIRKIRGRHWRALAEQCGLDADPVVDRVAEFLEAVPAAIRTAATSVRAEGLDHPVVDLLEEEITRRSAGCLDLMA